MKVCQKIYISCHHPDPANALAEKLQAAGHRVSSSWHSVAGQRPAADDGEAWKQKARNNRVEISNSDALVLIASPEHLDGTRRVSGGKFVEAGVALGRMVRVYTLGGVENGMLYDPLVIHARDVDHLLELIAHW